MPVASKKIISNLEYFFLTAFAALFILFANPAKADHPADLNFDCEVTNVDAQLFLNAFVSGDPLADLAEPYGQHNFYDVSRFIKEFQAAQVAPYICKPDPEPAAGWTEFNPSVDTNILYVSSTDGDDSTAVPYQWNAQASPTPFNHTGQIYPFRTVQAALDHVRNGYPDWVLLKRGDTWEIDESLHLSGKKGRSTEEKFLISAYGPAIAPRPQIITGNKTAFKAVRNDLEHAAITSLHFEAANRDPNYDGSPPAGVFLLIGGVGDILIEDLFVKGYKDNFIIQGQTGSFGYDVTLRRNIIVNSYSKVGHSQGIFASGVDGLTIEENILDENGYNFDVDAEMTIFNRNLYLSQNTNAILRGNIAARSSSPEQLRRGGLAEKNLFLKTPGGISFGHPENTEGSITNGAIRQNVTLHGMDIIREINDPADPTDDVIRQPQGRGFGIGEKAHNVEIYDNIVSQQRYGTGSNMGIQLKGTANPEEATYKIYGNIIYDWKEIDRCDTWGCRGNCITIAPSTPTLELTNNSCQQPAEGGRLYNINGTFLEGLPEYWHFNNNTYFTTNVTNHEITSQDGTGSFENFADATGETYVEEELPYTDPNRTMATYLDSLKISFETSSFIDREDAAVDAFMEKARQLRKGSWDERFTAIAAINYIREGFDLPPVE